jgi:hypothetical protein
MIVFRVLCFVLLATLGRADIEFVGILATSQSTRFALGDTATGKTEWLMAGDRFAGYTLATFDAKQDTLVLQRDGTELRVRLKDGRQGPVRAL